MLDPLDGREFDVVYKRAPDGIEGRALGAQVHPDRNPDAPRRRRHGKVREAVRAVAAHLLSRRLEGVVHGAGEPAQVLVERVAGPGAVLQGEELLVAADGLAGDEVPGDVPRGHAVLADGPQQEPAVDDARGDLGGDGHLVLPGVGERELAGCGETTQVLAVAGREGVAQAAVLERQLDVASAQLVLVGRGQPQWLVVAPVLVCQGTVRAAVGWSVGCVDAMVSHARLADPVVGHVSTHAGEVLEPLFLVLFCVGGGKLAATCTVSNCSAGCGEDDVVRGGQMGGDLTDEIDGHVQQG